MPRRVDIDIRGLSLCFIEDNKWNVVFICDPHHDLYLEYPGGAKPTELHLQDRNLFIEFNCSQWVISDARRGVAYDRLFNMSGPEAHGLDPAGNSRLVRRKRNNWNTDIVWMTVPNSELSVTNQTDPEYYIEEVTPTGNGTPKKIGPIAKQVTLSFYVDADFSIWVGDWATTFFRQYQIAGGNDPFRFVLDNDCHGKCTDHNDALDFYDIAIDEFVDAAGVTKERRFVTGKLVNGHVPGSNGSRALTEEEKSGLQGNCEPYGSEPPPGD